MRALVLNGYSRNSLSIIRSLGARKIAIDTVAHTSGDPEFDSRMTKRKSKFVGKVFYFEQNDSELQKIIALLKENKYDFLFAGGTYHSNLISEHKPLLEKYIKVASEEYNKVLMVHDKQIASRFIEELGIPVPKTYQARNPSELEQIVETLEGNAVVKLPDSYSSKGLKEYQGSVEEMIGDYSENYGFDFPVGQFPLIQQRIDGSLHDTTAFSVAGSPKGILSQIRMMPETLKAGSGIINKTTLEPIIIEYTRLILEKLSWTGHIELDWIKEKETGKYYFLEINPKFWGTNQLTISAGFDFPYWSVQNLMGEELQEVKDYRVGRTFRWLELEIVSIAKYSKGVEHFVNWAKFFLRFLNPKTLTSMFWKDLKPFWGDLKEGSYSVLKIYFWRLKNRKL